MMPHGAISRNRGILSAGLLVLLLTGFRAHAEEPQFLKQTFPGGFKLKEPVKFYDAGNLYEYIDGQAVFYISYRFRKLEHGYYERGNGTFYVDVYELGGKLSAFGAYRQQREEDAEMLAAGCEGAITDYLAVFYKDRYYVEIIPMESVGDIVESMKLLAGHVAGLIPGDTELPPELELFPKEGLSAGSERYVDENLISYSFMGRGLVARYRLPGNENEIRLFIAIAENDAKAREIFRAYRDKLGGASPVSIGETKGTKGKEPYRGITIVTAWKNYVFGCLDVEDEGKTIDLLNAALNNMKKIDSRTR